MSKQKPEHIRAALQVLEDLRAHAPEQEAAFRQILPVFAAKAAQSGEQVTEDFLKEHMVQGKDHMQDFVKKLQHQEARAEDSPLAQYEKIKAALRPEIDKINELLIDAAQSGDFELFQRCVEQGGDIGTEDGRALQYAAKNGHFDIVKYCFEHGDFSKSAKDQAQGLAVGHGHLEIVKYCLKQGCDIQSWNNGALCSAAVNGHLEVIEYCVAMGGDILARSNMPLQLAAESGHMDVVKYCVAKGGDILVRGNRPLQLAAENGHLEMVKYCLTHGDRNNRARIDRALYFAAKNGHMDVVRYCFEQGGDIETENGRILLMAAVNGDLEMVKYCFEHGDHNNQLLKHEALCLAATTNRLEIVKYCYAHGGCNSQQQKDKALYSAARNGHLDVVKYCLKQGGNIRVKNDKVLRLSALLGDLELVKNCVAKGGDIRASDNEALLLAAREGHLDVVKYCFEQGRAEGKRIEDDKALYIAAEYNRFDVAKYCVEQEGYNIKTGQDNALRFAIKNNNFEMAKYCIEQGGDLNNLLNPEKARNRLQNFDNWLQKHGTCPKGLVDFSPHYFKATAFADLLAIFDREHYRIQASHQYAYHTAGLFGSTKRVLTYLEKWGEYGKQPLHDIIQDIKLPQQGRFNTSAWADAVLKHGPKMARLVKFADKLSEPLKNGDGSWSYLKTRQEIAKFAYPKGALNPELASICLQYDWDDDDYNTALDHIEKYQKKYAANDNQKPKAHIPDIKIDGADFDKTGYLFYKLPDGDLRGLFLGEFTNCCQHLAGQGADCASHGFLSKHSGFYVVEDKETGDIVAQSWAWRGEDKALVLDSLESLSGRFNAAQWQKLTEKLATKIAENTADITALHIGTGGATPKLGFNEALSPSKPKKYKKYRDSYQQYQVWKRPG